ncbi:MAG TPA: crosslink repair DNA glycosylase YcaQ family protein [Thermomicrobiales bacterium]|jgi:hypothetical protein|nr:crosslink repair DNA glycosylase YcaQ family protein [Thermomicrobiales bacterium]
MTAGDDDVMTGQVASHDPDRAIWSDMLGSRSEGWSLHPVSRLTGVDDAPGLIGRAGIVTHFPVSPEFANLFHAWQGPDAEMKAAWDSPSGQLYTWRWELGRQEVAFYGTAVRGKPTWLAWDLLPALLALRGDTRPPAAQHADGLLSDDALRVAEALEHNGGTLSTPDLRRAAGFETGKDRRAAYLRAVAELDRRLLVGRTFGPPDDIDDTDMRQTLIAARYPDAVAAAEGLAPDEAIRTLLVRYLGAAAFVRPVIFARHLGLERRAVEAALADLAREGLVRPVRPADEKQDVMVMTTLPDLIDPIADRSFPDISPGHVRPVRP